MAEIVRLPARVGEFARAYAFSRHGAGERQRRRSARSSSSGFMDGVVLLLFLVVPVLHAGLPRGAGALGPGWGEPSCGPGCWRWSAVLAVLVWHGGLAAPFVRVAERVARFLPEVVARPLVGAGGVPRLRRDPARPEAPGARLRSGRSSSGRGTGSRSGSACSPSASTPASSRRSSRRRWSASAWLIPSAPGFFGTFHAAANFALSDVYGVPEAESLAFAFGYHFGGMDPDHAHRPLVRLVARHLARRSRPRSPRARSRAAGREPGASRGDSTPGGRGHLGGGPDHAHEAHSGGSRARRRIIGCGRRAPVRRSTVRDRRR
jgi:hypothetical protein